jgi:Flp pilus assembly protein TadG
MKLKRIYRDQAGASAIEFALTLPVFLLILMAISEGALLMWTELGLQHGVEKAARCASVDATLCASTSDIQTYAAQSSYGLNPPPSVFTLAKKACGNEVSANLEHTFLFKVFGDAPSITVKAQSCFPTT